MNSCRSFNAWSTSIQLRMGRRELKSSSTTKWRNKLVVDGGWFRCSSTRQQQHNEESGGPKLGVYRSFVSCLRLFGWSFSSSSLLSNLHFTWAGLHFHYTVQTGVSKSGFADQIVTLLLVLCNVVACSSNLQVETEESSKETAGREEKREQIAEQQQKHDRIQHSTVHKNKRGRGEAINVTEIIWLYPFLLPLLGLSSTSSSSYYYSLPLHVHGQLNSWIGCTRPPQADSEFSCLQLQTVDYFYLLSFAEDDCKDRLKQVEEMPSKSSREEEMYFRS